MKNSDVVYELSSVWRFCIFSKFCFVECTDVSHVARGVELTVHKESVVVEEIKEVKLRFRRMHLFIRGTHSIVERILVFKR